MATVATAERAAVEDEDGLGVGLGVGLGDTSSSAAPSSVLHGEPSLQVHELPVISPNSPPGQVTSFPSI